MNPKRYIQRAEVAVRHRLGLPNPWVAQELLGRALTVRAGTFPNPMVPDYDDAWLFACARNSRVVFDVGSNVGQSALLMLLAGSKQVLLVEANWRALSVAAENLIRNQFSSACRFVCAFASERADDDVEFWTVGTGAAGSMFQGHAKTASRAGSATHVRTTTLDSLSATNEIVPDLVKIDVEGAEHKVLAGARKIAAGHRTRFLVEMHSPPELPMEKNASLVLGWVAEHGLAAWYLDREERLEDTAQIAKRGRCHLLLQPASWSYPEWLAGIKQSADLPVMASSSLG